MNKIVNREKKAIKDYFRLEVEPEDLNLDKKKIRSLRSQGLGIHYLPAVACGDFPKGALSDYFWKLKKKGKLTKESLRIDPGWILVEKERKPAKKRIWLYKNPFFGLLDKLGLDSRRFCRLFPQLEKPEWNEFEKRVGVTREEIQSFLSDQEGGLRLPKYLEYVYLGDYFYNDWGETKTWEWLADRLKNERYLAAGAKKAKRLGADGPEHWSTILGFRLIVDLER